VDAPALTPKYLLIGEILRPHGVRGELRLRVLTDHPDHMAQLSHVYIGTDPDDPRIKRFDVGAVRFHQGYALLTLKQIPDRTAAELYRGLFVMVELERAVPLEDDEIYVYELIGMQVVTEDGQELGPIIEVLATGANDVYIVDSAQYGEILLPVTDETLLRTDTDTRRVIMRLPAGLLPSDS
jgi:16S rRNA processing protein RimM